MFSGGILFSGGGKLLLGVAGFHTGFFCWGGGEELSQTVLTSYRIFTGRRKNLRM